MGIPHIMKYGTGNFWYREKWLWDFSISFLTVLRVSFPVKYETGPIDLISRVLHGQLYLGSSGYIAK